MSNKCSNGYVLRVKRLKEIKIIKWYLKIVEQAVARPFTTPFKINNNNNDNNNNDDESRCANSITFANAHHNLRVKILQSTKAMKNAHCAISIVFAPPYVQRKCIQEFKQNNKNCSPMG